MVIFYCDKCGLRVPDADLESGAASQVDDVRALCGKCGGGGSKRRTTSHHVKRASPAGAAATNLSVQRPSGTFARASSQTGTHVRSAQAPSSEPLATSNKLVLFGAIGAGAFILILVLVLASSSKTTDEQRAGAKTGNPPDAKPTLPDPAPPPLPTAPRPSVPPTPDSPVGAPPTPPPSNGDGYDPRAFVAASKLTEAKAYRDKNPDDPWTADELLADICSTYRGTAAATEAEQIRKTLDLSGERPAQRMNWHQAWENLTPHDRDSHWRMDRKWDNRSFVLHTHPPKEGTPAEFKRDMKVPDDKPWLCFRVRGSDDGDFRCRIQIDGADVLSQDVGGRTWRTFCIDLSPKKGQQVNVHVLHENTGWAGEHGHWLAPEFLKEQPSGAQSFAIGSSPAFPALPATMDWSKAIDVGALVDRSQDVVDGSWTSQDGAISGQSANGLARLALPYAPPTDYDLRAIITRTLGNGSISFVLPRGDASVCCILAGKENTLSGFEAIDGNRLEDSRAVVTQAGTLQNVRPYNLVIRVRQDAIRVYLDDTPLVQTDAANARLSVRPERTMPQKAQLGLVLYSASYEVRKLEVLPVAGDGRILRGGVSQRTEPVATVTTSVLPEPDAYAVFLDGLLQALGTQAWEQMKSKLTEAGATPKLAAHAADVKQDAACATLALKVADAEAKGAAMLMDGQALTLEDTDGKRYEVGKKAKVLKVSDKGLQIQQNVGGGSLIFDIAFSSLTKATREELVQLGLGGGSEGVLAFAACRVGLLRTEPTPANQQIVERLLTKAARQHAPEDPVATLKRWMAFIERESLARTTLASLEQVLNQSDHDAAQAAYEAFRKDFANTAVFAGAVSRFPEFEKQLFALSRRPGLWGGCWKATKENRFVEMLYQDVVRRIGWENGDKEREKRFPNDWFTLRYGGLIKITMAGSYKFYFSADDRVRVSIDGKLVNNGKPLDLTEGDHQFRLVYEEDTAQDWLKLEWTLPGETGKSRIPDDVFLHRPADRASYLQPYPEQ